MSSKSISKNAFYNVIYKCLNVLFPLITIMYVSRVLMPEGVGIVASSQNIVAYFVIIASLGLPVYGVKKIAEYRDDRKKCSEVFSELLIINGISTIVCSLIYIMMLLMVDFFHSKIAISFVVGIQLFANLINIDWLYQGFEEYKYIMCRSFAVKLLALISVFLFVRDVDDYVIYALITTLSLVANFVFNIIKMPSFVDFTFKRLSIQRHLKSIFTLLAAAIAIEIYTLAATTILSVMKGDEIVGYFSNSVKTVSITRTMIAAICAVFLPRLNYYIGQNRISDFNRLANKGLKLLLSMSVPSCILVAVLADYLVYILFGEAYHASIQSMQILSISIITVAISNFTGYQILVSLGKERIVFYSTILGASTNIILNIFLIRNYEHYGAASASVISELVVAIYQFYYVFKYVPICNIRKSLQTILIPSILMLISMIFIKERISNIYISTLITILSGVAVYVLIGRLMKNEAILMIEKKLLKK